MTGPLFVGVDVGSSATKCVVLDAGGRIVGRNVRPSGFNYAQSAQASIDAAMRACGGSARCMTCCVSTGYGRADVPGSARRVTEITCHARGARQWYPAARTIIDIGGQDTKVIRLDADGRTTDYRMNAKCAAGTGTFLESIAVRLGCTLAEIDALAMRSTGQARVNSYCTVFAGTEVLERIKAGQPREDISMGLFRSIASRVLEMVAARDGPVAATGGVVAYCGAMVRALEEALGDRVLLPAEPQLAGAYGAALLGAEMDGAADPGSGVPVGEGAERC